MKHSFQRLIQMRPKNGLFFNKLQHNRISVVYSDIDGEFLIYSISVNPDFRNQGVFRAFIFTLIAQLKLENFKSIKILEIVNSILPARLTSYGFDVFYYNDEFQGQVFVQCDAFMQLN